ncbi:hypothetical protein TNCT_62981 [Trichonephila clavata]|uniref:Uncharacterized protein n=1 Tax=Trichonephila clavata TaxID=2740835 RepID=A0A8X6K564_TRICU|nr:hypothetical protein TNCT_62981 [Trichonephila clavata]
MHNPVMIEVLSCQDEVRRKPHVVMEYNNTMGWVDRMNQHLKNYKKQKIDLRHITEKYSSNFRFITAKFLHFILETGRKIISFEFQAIDRLIERHVAANERKRLIVKFCPY